jgi:hypothetical protein
MKKLLLIGLTLGLLASFSYAQYDGWSKGRDGEKPDDGAKGDDDPGRDTERNEGNGGSDVRDDAENSRKDERYDT